MDEINDYIRKINRYKNKINYNGIKLQKIVDNINKSKQKDIYQTNNNMILYKNYQLLLNNLLNNNKDMDTMTSIINIIKDLINNIYKNNGLVQSNNDILEIINKINDIIHNKKI